MENKQDYIHVAIRAKKRFTLSASVTRPEASDNHNVVVKPQQTQCSTKIIG